MSFFPFANFYFFKFKHQSQYQLIPLFMDGYLIYGSRNAGQYRCMPVLTSVTISPYTLSQLSRPYGNAIFLMKSFQFLSGCKHSLNDSFGHLNITYNGRFSPDCVWTLGNSGISQPVAIVSIDEVQFGYCR